MARKATKKQDDLAQAFELVARTDNGLQVLKAIFEFCGYDQQVMIFNPQTNDLNEKSTIYNLSKRDVWLQVRKQLSPEMLARIEIRRD